MREILSNFNDSIGQLITMIERSKENIWQEKKGRQEVVENLITGKLPLYRVLY